jgi:hypothetical protein
MASSTRIPGVPLQPGMTVRDYTVTDFKRRSRFGYAHGVMTAREKPSAELAPIDFIAPTLGMSLSRDGRAFGKSDAYSGKPAAEPFVPDYVHLDRQVLRYDVFFKEAVHESRVENFRVRRCLLLYYMIDGSMQISEPKVENSGMPQGESKGSVFLKRQSLPKPDGSGPYTERDLLVSGNVTIYGRVFRITDADKHTRETMAAKGLELAAAEETPLDPYSAKRLAEKEGVLRTQKYFRPRAYEDDLARYAAAKYGAAATALAPDRLREFLENDRKVLRFFLAWDDREQMYGELRPFILHYYLQDDTAEVLEVRRANSGRDPFPAFVSKGRLAKDVDTYIRTDAPTTHTTQLIDRSGRVDPGTMRYFSVDDFEVGATLTIYNRPFFVYGCDDFTREWYASHRGKAFVDIPIEFEPRQPRPQMELPPPLPLNMGDDADSLSSFIYLIPKPPHKNFHKMMENDRCVWHARNARDEANRAAGRWSARRVRPRLCASVVWESRRTPRQRHIRTAGRRCALRSLALTAVFPPCALPPLAPALRVPVRARSKILRFMARLDSAEPEDGQRTFVIKIFLADDTIAVFEPPLPNSGLVGGKFLERGVVKNIETGAPFGAADFYTGARVRLNGWLFTLYQVGTARRRAAAADG